MVLGYSSNDSSDFTVRFGRLIGDIFFESGITVPGLIDVYIDTIHNWLPLIDVKKLCIDAQPVLKELPRPEVLLLLLAILLLTEKPCCHRHHLRDRRLHKALKVVGSALQSQHEPGLCLVQAQALIALYECGHGMTRQAHLTLSSATTLAITIANDNDMGDDSLHWQTALMMLDR